MKLPAVGAQSVSQAQLPENEPSDEELAEIAEDLGLAAPDSAEQVPPDVAPGPPQGEDTYPDWNSENSFVISGPLGLRAKYPGRRFANWHAAQEYVNERYRVVKFWCFANRWYVRVRK